VILRPFDDTHDRPLVYAWLSDREAAYWLADHAAPVTDADLDAWRDTPGTSRWIIEHEGQPVGYGEIREDAAGAYSQLGRLLVDPARRQRGIGSALARTLAAQARATRPDWPVYTRIHPENVPAILAYPSAGLVPLEPLPAGLDDTYLWLTPLPEGEPAEPGGSVDGD
jgi:[ribosomal protein S18]-alanine N-acetyltransferase